MTTVEAPPTPPTTRDVRAPLLVGAAVAVGTAFVAAGDPTSHHVPLCPFNAVTGLDCPFCGGLRSVFELTRGNVARAADHNLLFVVALPFLVAGWAAWLWRSLHRDRHRRLVRPAWIGPALFVLAAAFMVARNLPALTWLASGA